MQIHKATGEQEPFDVAKLCNSIESSGAPHELAQKICGVVEQKIKPNANENIASSQIWRMVLSYLAKENPKLSARYSLKNAIAELGPDGFVFEQFVEALFQVYGYETQRGIYKMGASGVEHEIDVVLHKNGHDALVEAKFKNQVGLKTHIDHVMYAYARTQDIIDKEHVPYESWLITNTKFTDVAKKYAEYRKMNLIGWNYPAKGNFADMIYDKNLWPITILPSLSRDARDALIHNNIILVQDFAVLDPEYCVKQFQLSEALVKQLLEEAKVLIKI